MRLKCSILCNLLFLFHISSSIVFQYFLLSNFNSLRNIRKIHYLGKDKFIRLNVVRESTTLTMLLVSLKKKIISNFLASSCVLYTHTHVCVCILFSSMPIFLIINLSSETWKITQLAEIFLKRSGMTVAWMVLHPPSLAIGVGSQRFPPFPTIGIRAVRDEEKFYLNQTTKTCISSLLSPFKTPALLGSGSNCIFSSFLMHLSWIKFLVFESN